MLFESTIFLLRGIVHSIEDGDEPRWDGHLESVNQALYELHQMSHSSIPKRSADSKDKFQAVVPMLDRSIRAIPHVKSMLKAIRQKDQAAAVESGKAAIGKMCGVRTVLPVESVEPHSNATDLLIQRNKPASRVSRQKKSARQARAAASKREPARRSVATAR